MQTRRRNEGRERRQHRGGAGEVGGSASRRRGRRCSESVRAAKWMEEEGDGGTDATPYCLGKGP